MALWNQVEVVYGSDETAVFGPRRELGTAPLYQVDTIAIVSADGRVDHAPEIHAAVAESVVCVSASHHLQVFQEEGQKLCYTAEFQDVVEQVACTDDGSVIAVGDHTGRLTFLSPQRQLPLFSQLLCSKTTQYATVFCNIMFVTEDQHGKCQLLVLLSSGTLFCYENINLATVKCALAEDGVETLQQLQQQIVVRVVDTSDSHTLRSAWVTVLQSMEQLWLVSCGIGESALCLWEKVDQNKLKLCWEMSGALEDGTSIVKCVPVVGGTCLLCLDDNNSLKLYNSHSLALLQDWAPHKVTDFLLIEGAPNEDNNNYSSTTARVVLLSVPENGHRDLLVCALANSTPIYSLELSAETCLAKMPTGHSTIVITEGVSSGQDGIDSLRIRSLTEALPETRFYRLLHKHQFEEAESFAKLFGQDLNLVHKTKFSYLLEQLSPWQKVSLSSSDVRALLDDLKASLVNIKEDIQVLENCVGSALLTYEATQDILVHTRALAKDILEKPDMDVTRKKKKVPTATLR